jgi:putative tryptophan/tyrosine transport system substrate-binding protein
MGSDVRRREFIALVGGAAIVAPVRVRSQQTAKSVIGFLSTGSPDTLPAPILAAFREGLAEAGYVEGQNVAIEYRFAEGRYERLPQLAAELVKLPVAVIVTSGSLQASSSPQRWGNTMRPAIWTVAHLRPRLTRSPCRRVPQMSRAP